jgi:PAS domain-containing protein
VRLAIVSADHFEYVVDSPDSDWNHEPSRDELFKALQSPLYTTDPDGWLTYYNDAAALFWGYQPILGQTRWCGSWRLYEPDGAPLPHDQSPMAVTLREGRAVRGVQAILERPDETRVPFLPYPALLRDRQGKLVGGSCIVLPLTKAPSRVLSGLA